MIDELEIRNLLARYSRGVDRADWDLVRRCFEPGASIDYGMVSGTVDDLIGYAEEGLAPMVGLQHFLGQSLVEVRDGDASAETYVWAFHRLPGVPETDLTLGGRYIDRLSKGAAGWRIVDRVMAVDWVRHDAVVLGPLDVAVTGRRSAEDRSYSGLPETSAFRRR